MEQNTGKLKCVVCSGLSPAESEKCTQCGAELVEPQGKDGDPLVASVIENRFLIIEKIGAGGMGMVYRAEQLSVHRQVAVKILTKWRYSDDVTLAARFQKEAESASKLTNPHTVTIFDFGVTEDRTLFMTMELIDGRSLTGKIKKSGAIEWHEAFSIAEQIADSIAEAHSIGIVHRDLKPDNVMLIKRGGDDDYVKVLDFGIAKVLEKDGTDQLTALTRTGMVFGTPQYMAPEQIRGETILPQTDIYALGVMIYEMIAGKLPFDSESPMGVLTKHLTEEPRPLGNINDDLPADAVRLVEIAMEKNPEDRFSSMEEMASQMKRIRESLSRKTPGTATYPETLPKKKKDFSLIIPVVLVIAVAVAAVFLWHLRSRRSEESGIMIPTPELVDQNTAKTEPGNASSGQKEPDAAVDKKEDRSETEPAPPEGKPTVKTKTVKRTQKKKQPEKTEKTSTGTNDAAGKDDKTGTEKEAAPGDTTAEKDKPAEEKKPGTSEKPEPNKKPAKKKKKATKKKAATDKDEDDKAPKKVRTVKIKPRVFP